MKKKTFEDVENYLNGKITTVDGKVIVSALIFRLYGKIPNIEIEHPDRLGLTESLIQICIEEEFPAKLD
jgi:hypothetical protein